MTFLSLYRKNCKICKLYIGWLSAAKWCISGVQVVYKSHPTFNKSCIFYNIYKGGSAALVDAINNTRFVEPSIRLVATYTPGHLHTSSASAFGRSKCPPLPKPNWYGRLPLKKETQTQAWEHRLLMIRIITNTVRANDKKPLDKRLRL